MKVFFSHNVWRVALAEIVYSRFTLALLFLTLTLTFNMFNSLEQAQLNRDPIFPHLAACALMYLLFTNRLLEKRTRFIHLTALSVNEHAVVRLASQFAYIGFALLAYVIIALVYLPEEMLHVLLWRASSFSALLFISNAVLNISMDLWAGSDTKAYNTIMIIVIWLSFILFASLYAESWIVSLMQPQKTAFFRMLYFTALGVLLQHIIAIAVNYCSIKLFIHRNSMLT
jgi:hypothetical protein